MGIHQIVKNIHFYVLLSTALVLPIHYGKNGLENVLIYIIIVDPARLHGVARDKLNKAWIYPFS